MTSTTHGTTAHRTSEEAAPGTTAEAAPGTVGAAAAAAGPSAGLDLAEVERFAYKIAQDQAIATVGALGWLGDRLGLWACLAAAGPVTSTELAAATGLAERYLREWLASQFAAGNLRHDPASGRFHLPAEWAAVLADPDSPVASAGGYESLMGFYAAADRLVEAFRTGGGIGWGTHDPRLYSGVDRFFAPLYRASLVREWLPALGGVVERLRAGAKVLDVGCGHGTSTLLMAEAFPASTFHGVDPHPESINAARTAANRAGVADWTTFSVAPVTGGIGDGYDLICFFDSFHHVRDAVAAAVACRRAMAPGGTLMLVEPRAGDSVQENTDVVGLSFYAASTLVCLPDALSQHDHDRDGDGDHGADILAGERGARDALGGMAGPARLGEVLTAAGFGSVRVAAETMVNIVVEARQ
ncbi:class I SAM-dependent methyltransferase [Parafrankia discariae]|uniref:class I SAM-dependent methyltransferase n=1 Tax=Parafrankia discariae TaxID=365528 RepID=UPI0003A2C394|nr:class I SAM-dependent methyltransferase [Parafrankia discariae]